MGTRASMRLRICSSPSPSDFFQLATITPPPTSSCTCIRPSPLPALAPPPYGDTLGKKVDSSGGYSVADALAILAPSLSIESGLSAVLFRDNPESEIWHTVLDGHPNTMYIAFRSCPSDPGTAFDEVIRNIENNAAIERLIVDVRANSGENSYPGTLFASKLGATILAKKRGGVVVLAGPYIFSSALMNTADILAACGALFRCCGD